MTDVDGDAIDSTARVAGPTAGVELMRARLWQATQDLLAGRISPVEANRITKEAGRELREVEAAMRVAKLAIRAAKLEGR